MYILPISKLWEEKMIKKPVTLVYILLTILVLAACGNSDTKKVNKNINLAPDDHLNMETKHSVTDNTDVEDYNSGIVLPNIKKASTPAYPVGSRVAVLATHKEGMKGAKGTIVGAYDSTAYQVDYAKTSDVREVMGYKWIVQEEIQKSKDKLLQPGEHITLEADHLPGMKGARARIITGKKTNVYMINYQPTTGEAKERNYKWVIESELTKEQ